MARPLPAPSQHQNRSNGSPSGRGPSPSLLSKATHDDPPADASGPSAEEAQELERLRDENAQLRALCLELEQALHEATQNATAGGGERLQEYEALLDEKTEKIRELAEQVQQLQAVAAELEGRPPARPANAGPAPREDDLLALSEELERERRQLQEDEQSLMQQMREMEVSMAKERAEMARQRNDLQRLQSEIRHELERLERCGALQTKIDGLKSKLQDATSRRGSAPGLPLSQTTPPAGSAQAPPSAKKDSLLGRLFGGGK